MSDRFKRAIHFLGWEAFLAYMLPPLTSAVTIVIGWFSSWPWFLIWIGTGVMFAATANGLLRFDEWRTRVTSKDKLVFTSIRIKKALSPDGSISAVSLGCQFRNIATFPIQFHVEEMMTELMGVPPPKKPYVNDTITVSVNNNGWFDDYLIDLTSVSRKGTLAEGTVTMRLSYGRSDNRKHTLEVKKKVFLKFDDRGDAQMAEWHDL